ncbi:MAG TPA: response regulator [Planctomycetes bacterium]|nr:response regulator [Planctomycetota bacterium]
MNKILIVDDSSTMRKIIMRVLRQAGLHVEEFLEAGNGAEGLKSLMESPDVELVLSDINMPQMDGVAFVQAVRSKLSAEQLPMIMISTESGNSKVQSALDSGANGYVSKPFTPDTIRAALEPYFG